MLYKYTVDLLLQKNQKIFLYPTGKRPVLNAYKYPFLNQPLTYYLAPGSDEQLIATGNENLLCVLLLHRTRF